MPNHPTRRIPPTMLQADLDSYAALQAVESYAPMNGKCELGALATLKQKMETRQTAETQAAGAFDAARDAATETEWEFHEVITLAKTQVEAQYGPSSDQLQSLGRKKQTEYARPVRRGSSKQGSNQ
jgi:hypothetical protein